MGRHTWYPNKTMSSDWDVLHAIANTLQLFPIRPAVAHVKGHQVNNAPYDQLPLEAQQSIDADPSTTLYQIDHGKVHGIDTSTRAEAWRNKTHQELKALYSLRVDM
jgi:hypothetical protein